MPSASDASDGAPQDAAEAAAHQPRPHLADAAAGKSAVLELDALEPGALQSDAQPPPTPVVQAQPDAEAELYKQDAAQSAEQSFAVPAAVERWEPETQPDAVLSPAEPQIDWAVLQQEWKEQLQLRAAVVVWPDAAVPQLEAEAQYEQASPLLWGPQPERRAQVAPVQPQALEQQQEQGQPTSLTGQAEPQQVSPRPAALLGGLGAEPQPPPSSA
jgi:hypothetical protein